jgi:hypothetical protein
VQEGWHGDDYLILFNEPEMAQASERYGIAEVFPGHVIVGLRGWDDFIVRDERGNTFSVPTVPLDARYLSPFSLPKEPQLKTDSRFSGKIKWYVKPLVFGGDLHAGENVIWISQEQHAQIVRWWNALYRSTKK